MFRTRDFHIKYNRLKKTHAGPPLNDGITCKIRRKSASELRADGKCEKAARKSGINSPQGPWLGTILEIVFGYSNG